MPNRKVAAEFGSRPVGATTVRERSLVPDLARGAMLLLIALANAPLYLYGDGSFGYGMVLRGYPILDRVIVLLQSVVFVVVLAAYGGGLGDRFGIVEIAVLATVTWALTVLLAEGMSRRGYRGPAEVLLRRLTYGPR